MSIQTDINNTYTYIGELAQYNGSDVSVCCFRETGQSDVGEYVRREAECRVRVSEVPAVVFGTDVLTYGGREWVVIDVQLSDAWEHVLMLADDAAMQMG